jgi:MFS transporter, putative metabolite:H+ symporter
MVAYIRLEIMMKLSVPGLKLFSKELPGGSWHANSSGGTTIRGCTGYPIPFAAHFLNSLPASPIPPAVRKGAVKTEVSEISARLDRVPFCRFHRNLLLMGGLGYTFDALDSAVIAFVLPVLRTSWSLTDIQIGFVGSGTYVGYLFGAMLAGLVGDWKGRRPVMLWALVLYCVASLASATASGWHLFVVCRVIAGVGAGAEGAIVAPFLSEFVSRTYRGRFTASLAGFYSFGYVGAALLGYFLVPLGPEGWRYVLALTAAPILMLLWWRRALPESPRWLQSVGRFEEADRVVVEIEASARRSGYLLAEPEKQRPVPMLGRGNSFAGKIAMLWVPGLRKITAMTWIIWASITFSYYAFFTWIPTLLVRSGMTIARSFSYSLAIYISTVPGYFSAAWLIERIGRQATIASYMVLGAISAIGLSLSHADASVMVAGCCLSFFMNGTYAGIYAYTPELFPTELRATGTGMASSIGRIGAIVSPVAVGWLYPRLGFAGVFGATTLVLLAGAVAVMVMGISTRGRSLEEISSEAIYINTATET